MCCFCNVIFQSHLRRRRWSSSWGPQQHKTPERKHSPTDISKRLRSSENNMDCIYMTPLHCLFALSLFWWPEPLGNIWKISRLTRNFPDHPETILTLRKLSRPSKKYQVHPETFKAIQKTFWTIQKISRLSGNFPGYPETFQTIRKIFRLSGNFPG